MFLKLDIPITFSILPRLDKSKDLAFEIHGRGHEVMLHQPMEPYNPSLDPGPGALYAGYESEKISNIVSGNIQDVPHVLGVNNHMGSRFTSCRQEIGETLRVVKSEGLFFVDSLTSTRSLAYKTAKKLEMPSAYRNIFLDNRPEESYILRQLYRLQKCAVQFGQAIGIGHPYPETAKALERFSTFRPYKTVSMVHASRIVRP
jgi:polysaccharide deacetylase 2 family uncharacterized protein YibQ